VKKSRRPTFFIFIVEDPRGLTRHGEQLERGTRFAIKSTSSRSHVDRWLKAKRIRQFTPPAGECGVCGCTELNCAKCIARTGTPCHWLDPEHTVCSACYGAKQ
jgi:hypothetical protein